MRKDNLTKAVKVLALIMLGGLLIKWGKPFLVPLVFAGLFAMLLLPLSMKMENKGINRGISVTLSILTLLVGAGIIIGVLAWQISDISKNSGQIEQNVKTKIAEAQKKIASVFKIPPQKQQQIIRKQQQSSESKINSFITRSLALIGGALTNILIFLVYLFLFMFYRDHLKTFLLKLVPRDEIANTRQVVSDGRKVAQKYLTGLSLMIVSLWIMYSIGFSLVGVKNAVFFAILCGTLEIVPFVGNLIGNALTVFMTIAQGGSMQMVISILIVYSVVQFLQSYFLEPLVVGSRVNIHPLITIIGIIAGEFVWGIPGMILAIPILGITKIICDHVPALEPYGYLLGEEKKEGEGFLKKIKGWFKKK